MKHAKSGVGQSRQKNPINKPTIKLWFIDLDDTVMESSGGMLHAIHLRMNVFIRDILNVTWEEADRLRKRYWALYGSTFIGMWRHHHIDPRVFLPATHDFDFSSYVRAQGSPRQDLKLLKASGAKVVLFTNGPRHYAEVAIALLGLSGIFDSVITSTEMRIFGEWEPKPSIRMLRGLCSRLHVKPSEAAIVDDSLMNLRTAKRMGMRTFWCTGCRVRHGKLTHRRLALGVDHVVVRLRDLSRFVSAYS